jgi:hypothetical protein
MQSCNGGTQEWELNKWYTAQGKIVMCSNGFHLTLNPKTWTGKRVFIAETPKVCEIQPDKVVVRRVRLLRELTPQLLETYEKAKAQLLETYENAEVQLWETYKKAKAQLWETYKKAKAQLLETYEKAEAQLRETYKKAKAQLRETYKKQCQDFLAKLCAGG